MTETKEVPTCERCSATIDRNEEGVQCDDGTILCNDCALHLFDEEAPKEDIDDDGGVF